MYIRNLKKLTFSRVFVFVNFFKTSDQKKCQKKDHVTYPLE